MKIKEFGSHIIDMYADGFDEDVLNTEFSKSGFEEFHKNHGNKYLLVNLIDSTDDDQIITTFDMSGTFPGDDDGLMTRYAPTGAYAIGPAKERNISAERTIELTIWVTHIFDYINFFENNVDVKPMYKRDVLYEED